MPSKSLREGLIVIWDSLNCALIKIVSIKIKVLSEVEDIIDIGKVFQIDLRLVWFM
jgi:hypothetical protein